VEGGLLLILVILIFLVLLGSSGISVSFRVVSINFMMISTSKEHQDSPEVK
jgi:hypothetical protein